MHLFTTGVVFKVKNEWEDLDWCADADPSVMACINNMTKVSNTSTVLLFTPHTSDYKGVSGMTHT